MAAAVFLHNAIFAADPPSPPAATAATLGAGAHRAPNRRAHHAHDRRLSSVSSITLQTSTSDHSHPTESLIHPDHLGSSESSVYLDLLARQPTHPGSLTHPPDRTSGLTLQGDAVSPRERKERHEKEVRRRLRRLRLVQRVLWVIIEFLTPRHVLHPAALNTRSFVNARAAYHFTTGLGGQCDNSPAWGFWLAGSLVRLIFTAGVLTTYHAVSYKYMVTRRPSRRRHTPSIFRHSEASFRSQFTTITSSRSFRPMTMTSTSTVPVSSPTAVDGPGQTSPPRNLSGTMVDLLEPHSLRTHSRITAGDLSPSGPSKTMRRASAQGFKNVMTAPQDTAFRTASPSSSEGADTDEDWEDRYGRPVPRMVGGYASLPLNGSPPPKEDGVGPHQWDPISDSDLNEIASRFRSLVEQVTRDTNDATPQAHRENDRYEFPVSYDRDRDRDDAHFVLGRAIHRMPTIESLGSHEVISLASTGKGGFSRNSTRSNTLSTADAPASRSASRANSLDAAVSLSVSGDGLAAWSTGTLAETGELSQSPVSTNGTAVYFGSRSTTTSYHTARSAGVHTDELEES
ncbi:hypothetical protein GSI_11615 [Ganoderma sinense ZZ0214-1]|uniref:Uncharacterized protein n=1 Tax=Ganoderma sinense ZZ0214-1 TaxID=1077348 RepID=A0A2G8RWH4_9APHY|nr:hypothetical protein GSI_11615 [Ganoderma sinense ZZ0214-1]